MQAFWQTEKRLGHFYSGEAQKVSKQAWGKTTASNVPKWIHSQKRRNPAKPTNRKRRKKIWISYAYTPNVKVVLVYEKAIEI